jgi:hypothetical protein
MPSLKGRVDHTQHDQDIGPSVAVVRHSLSNQDFLNIADNDEGAKEHLEKQLESMFMDWIREPDHVNKYRISWPKRRAYMNYLRDDNYPRTSQADRNNRQRAKDGFVIKNNLLFHKDSPKDREVIMGDAAYSTIRDIHTRHAHIGRDKTWAIVQANYYGITRDEISWVLDNCRVCRINSRGDTRAPLTVIKSYEANERLQIDLVDKLDRPCGQYKWIMHVRVSICLLILYSPSYVNMSRLN